MKKEQEYWTKRYQEESTGWDIGYAAIYLLPEKSRWVTAVNLPTTVAWMDFDPRVFRIPCHWRSLNIQHVI